MIAGRHQKTNLAKVSTVNGATYLVRQGEIFT
jgi:hypothetical protein